MRLITLAFVILATSSFAAAQMKSVYTKTAATDCKTIESNPNEGGSYLGECKGVGGFKLRLSEGDLRQSLEIVSPSGSIFDLKFPLFYSSFSSIGSPVEWRTKSGVPVALIARFRVSNPEDSSKTTSYLMVSKLSRTAACVTDIVPPGRTQNAEARKLADASSSKPCKEAKDSTKRLPGEPPGSRN